MHNQEPPLRYDDVDEDDSDDDSTPQLERVEVERMPDFGGFEFYKAVDLEEGRDRWVAAIRYRDDASALEYAFWDDTKAEDALRSEMLDASPTAENWPLSVQDAIDASDGRTLDDQAREAVLLAIAKRCDPSFNYEDRLVFAFASEDLDNDDIEDDDDDDIEDDDDD